MIKSIHSTNTQRLLLRGPLRGGQALSTYASKRQDRSNDIDKLVEVQQFYDFEAKLKSHTFAPHTPNLSTNVPLSFTRDRCRNVLLSGFATFQLHVESRIASMLGEGFYTIGPCGEEMTASFGMLLDEKDPSALHYRHLSAQIARQLNSGSVSMDEILLARARGYTCSSLDPVTGGAHCAIGGGPLDFYVTSTLASQTPSAVGRALASTFSRKYLPEGERKFGDSMISFVSLGDGSVNNAMFLAGANMSEYAQHRGFKCPVLFAVTDNDLCISLRGYNWLDKFLDRQLMPVFRGSGFDMLDSYGTTEQAMEYVRTHKRPAILALKTHRRFGHAATDRQNAYLTDDEITQFAATNSLENACHQALQAGLVDSPAELYDMWMDLRPKVERAFAEAAQEPKLDSREDLVRRVSAPLAPIPAHAPSEADLQAAPPKKVKKELMRKNMNKVIMETMELDPKVVYIGEDVRHGGYYLVTEGAARKFNDRVIDFPPDETSLVGAGMGFAQAGLVPVVEIPYAKYLDCGADMFFESILMHWATNGAQPNGMVIRLQGFDRGIFGGNFHTHNMLHLPPGLDVVCYSNGADYVRGFRNAIHQAKAGRVVMLVDSTDLLNRRHLNDKDNLWMKPFPKLDGDQHPMLPFDHVMVYKDMTCKDEPATEVASASDVDGVFDHPKLVIVSYGNGVPIALQAGTAMLEKRGDLQAGDVLVVDCPYLTPGELPEGLRRVVGAAEAVVFADVCKFGQHPLASMITQLQVDGELPSKWQSVGASPTYNPLGRITTFLSVDDITTACDKVV